MSLFTNLKSSLRRKNYFVDIRLWIVIFFLVRLYAITLPPLEVGHNWRQADGLMIARNFYEISSDIRFPRVDLAGEKTGIVGSEFPLLNYLIYLTSVAFGFSNWYGRLIVLLFSSLGVLYFAKIISRYFGEKIAFNSAIILTASLWFSYSRKTIPDVMAVSMTLMALHFGLRYFETGRIKMLVPFLLFGAMGCLAKILAAVILTPLVIPLFNRNYSFLIKATISSVAAIILFIVWYWYFQWVPYLNEQYGFGEHFFMGSGFREGLAQISERIRPFLLRLFVKPIKYLGLIAFLCGVIFLFVKKNKLAIACFTIPYVTFLFLLSYTGASVIDDVYYLITIIPVISFVAGYALSLIKTQWIAVLILVSIAVENLGDQIYDFRIRDPLKPLAQLEQVMNKVSQRGDLIAINSTSPHNPTAMFFAHRRGWAVLNQHLLESNHRAYLKAHGCKLVVILKNLYGNISLEYPILYESDNFKIYKLN
jgi:hypothetical protein